MKANEEGKVAPYFMRSDDAPKYERGAQIIPIDTCNDYVAIVRDELTSTIQLTGDTQLPSGVIVGAPASSHLVMGDHVRFNDIMVAVKDAQYPGYENYKLIIIAEKFVLYKLP